MDKLNIIVLAEEMEQRVMIKERLDGENVEICGYAGFDDAGKLKIQSMMPDVILCVTVGKPDDDIFTYIHNLLFEVKNCSLVMMNDNISIELVSHAAEIGIRKVIPLDMGAGAIMKELQRIYSIDLERQLDSNEVKKVRSKVISFFGGKGGTGKTMTAVNVAAALTRSGKRVMLIDFDLQFGDVALMLDMEPKDTIVDLVRDKGDISIESINNYALVHNSGMSVLSAPLSAEYAEYVTPQHVEKIISVCRFYFEYVIIDLPANFNDVSIAVCENSDEIMLVYNMEILSLKNSKSFVSILDHLHQKSKINLILNESFKGILKNADFERVLKSEIYANISLDTKSVITAINNGQPIVISNPHCTVSKEITAIAENIIKRHSGTQTLMEMSKTSKSGLLHFGKNVKK